MAAIVKPSRQVSFSDLAKVDPRSFPADRLDSQIQNLIDAIHSTQLALAEVRRDDGQLRMPPEQRRERADLEKIENRLVQTTEAVTGAVSAVSATAKDVHLRVKDAEIAAFTSVSSLAEVERRGAEVQDAYSDVENAADAAQAAAIASQNSANYAHAQTDNAIAAKVEATQWAEYLAGPVVNSTDAPAYIQGHPFGHGLYYQPVEGGAAGLWSAKWWALYAQQLVGAWGFYYLGSWPAAPIPGSTNPSTGMKVPNPLAPGSFYYNTTTHQLFVWDGSFWNEPYEAVLTPGFTSSFTYIATAGQTVFYGPDAYGKTPEVGLNPSDVHVSGLRLVYGAGYSVNASTNRLTLANAVAANTVVQWDLLVSQDELGAGGVTIRKVIISPTPNGTNTNFTMTWIDPDTGSTAVDIAGGLQLQLVLDGVIQEPGIDYVASGAVLTMSGAPQVNSKFWALWFAAGAVSPPPASTPPVNAGALPAISGQTLQGSLLTATTGGWTGYPVPLYSFQWKAAGVNVGTDQNAYVTQPSDATKMISVVVTATNSSGSASATSGNFGPVIAVDTTPAAFTFTDVNNVALSAVVISNSITVSAINSPSTLSITGGDYSINSGAFATASTTVVNGDTVRVRGTASASNSTAVNVTLTIGGVSDVFTITTLAAAPTYKPTYLIYFV